MKHEILLTSPPDRDELVAEIWIDGHLFGELRRAGSHECVEIYKHPITDSWTLPTEELQRVLTEAKSKLFPEDVPRAVEGWRGGLG